MTAIILKINTFLNEAKFLSTLLCWASHYAMAVIKLGEGVNVTLSH